MSFFYMVTLSCKDLVLHNLSIGNMVQKCMVLVTKIGRKAVTDVGGPVS